MSLSLQKRLTRELQAVNVHQWAEEAKVLWPIASKTSAREKLIEKLDNARHLGVVFPIWGLEGTVKMIHYILVSSHLPLQEDGYWFKTVTKTNDVLIPIEHAFARFSGEKAFLLPLVVELHPDILGIELELKLFLEFCILGRGRIINSLFVKRSDADFINNHRVRAQKAYR